MIVSFDPCTYSENRYPLFGCKEYMNKQIGYALIAKKNRQMVEYFSSREPDGTQIL